MNALELAKAACMKMLEGDVATHHLKMEITHVGVGEATLTMPVQDFMLNGHKTAHGGYIFTLADSAFAFACNSYNQRTVAQSCHITFTSAGMMGDVLTATATEQSRAGRSGVYDVTVTNQTGATIALFRGLSRTVKGVHVELQS
jgi:acyl-CoA thioesterase